MHVGGVFSVDIYAKMMIVKLVQRDKQGKKEFLYIHRKIRGSLLMSTSST